MKKLSKAALSIILCLVFLIAVCAPAFASSEKTAFIVVSGMNSFPLYYENGEQAYPIDSNTLTKTIAKAILPAAKYLLTGDGKALAKEISPVLYDAFKVIACDESGNSINKINAKLFDCSLENRTEYFINETSDEQGVVRAGIEKYGKENTFFFNYDWRLDPLDHADRLNTFIKTVKAQTKCDRVAVAAFSMGGTVTCAYLYKYGSADVDSISLCSTAFQGTSSLSDLFTGEVGMDAEGLFRRLAQLTRDNTYEDLINCLNKAMTLSGINKLLSDFANKTVAGSMDEVYAGFITPIFGYMPGMWALVTGESYLKAKAVLLNEKTNAELIKRIDEYHYNVQANAESILKKAQEDTNVCIIAQYNMQGLPVSEKSTKSNNDYLIDAEYASGGAVCAKLGEVLPEDYKQQRYPEKEYLSPDGQIDASTCMLPESTWFIKDMGHVDYPLGESTDFILALADSKTQMTVFDKPEYPQFMKYTYKTNSLTPVGETVEKTTADKIFGAIEKIMEAVSDTIGKAVKK